MMSDHIERLLATTEYYTDDDLCAICWDPTRGRPCYATPTGPVHTEHGITEILRVAVERTGWSVVLADHPVGAANRLSDGGWMVTSDGGMQVAASWIDGLLDLWGYTCPHCTDGRVDLPWTSPGQPATTACFHCQPHHKEPA